MTVDYSREFILANVDLAQRYKTCGHTVNLGAALLVAICDDDSENQRYSAAISGVRFDERGVEDIKDEHVRFKGECIAYAIKEKMCKVIISSDEQLNSRLINALCLKPCAPNAVL